MDSLHREASSPRDNALTAPRASCRAVSAVHVPVRTTPTFPPAFHPSDGPRVVPLDHISWWHVRQRFAEALAVALVATLATLCMVAILSARVGGGAP